MTGVFVALVASCTDTVTSPTGAGLAPKSAAAAELLDSPSSGSADFSVGGEAPLAGNEQVIGYFPTPTVLDMTVHQAFTITNLPPYPPGSGFIGLSGRSSGFGCSHQGEAYLVEFPDDGGFDFAFAGCDLAGAASPVTSFSTTVMVQGWVRYGYAYDAACPYPDAACASYSGGSGISLTRLTASLAITGDSVRNGELRAFPQREYTLSATPSPTVLGKFGTPVFPVSWTFQPDSGAVETDICRNGNARSCTAVFAKLGYLTLVAIVNGEQKTSAPLRVQTPKVTLTLSTNSAVVGDTVIATTTVAGMEPTALSYFVVSTFAPDGHQIDIVFDRAATAGLPPLLAAAAASKSGAANPGIVGDAHADSSATPNAATNGQLHVSAARRSANNASAAALPPCIGTKPVPLQCYIVMRTAGRAHVEVGAILDIRRGFAAYDYKDVAVQGSDGRVVIEPASGPSADVRMPPSEIVGISSNQVISTKQFRVRVVNAAGSNVPNAVVRLSLKAEEFSGGHEHARPSSPKPAGSYGTAGSPTLTVNTGPSGVATVTYQAPDPSGLVTLHGESDGNQPGDRPVTIAVDGLIEQEELPGILQHVGEPGSHHSRFWVTPETRDMLIQLADTLTKRYDGVSLPPDKTHYVGLNDASLVFGGMFDIGGAWLPPHADHRRGQGVDLRTSDKTAAQAEFMRTYWELTLGGGVYDETAGQNPDATGPHYHFKECPRCTR